MQGNQLFQCLTGFSVVASETHPAPDNSALHLLVAPTEELEQQSNSLIRHASIVPLRAVTNGLEHHLDCPQQHPESKFAPNRDWAPVLPSRQSNTHARARVLPS